LRQTRGWPVPRREGVAATKESYTGQYLPDLLGRRGKGRAEGAQASSAKGRKQAAE
jgi:hypothetical protein